MTAAQTSPHSIPLPADAVRAQWQDLGTPAAFRYFEGSRWTVDRRADLSSWTEWAYPRRPRCPRPSDDAARVVGGTPATARRSTDRRMPQLNSAWPHHGLLRRETSSALKLSCKALSHHPDLQQSGVLNVQSLFHLFLGNGVILLPRSFEVVASELYLSFRTGRDVG